MATVILVWTPNFGGHAGWADYANEVRMRLQGHAGNEAEIAAELRRIADEFIRGDWDPNRS